MAKYLLIDIGAGTMDVLFWDEAQPQHYKAVVMSPVRLLASQAASLPGNLAVTGTEMGGGPVSDVLKKRTRDFDVVMSDRAAATIHHDMEKVRGFGIQVKPESEVRGLQREAGFNALTLADLSPGRIKNIVTTMGVPFSFDVVGICAQDHGVPPTGVSHLDFRHQLFKKALDKSPYPHALLYAGDAVPPVLNRLSAIAQNARELPTREVYVMDSGMAAVMGASLDPTARSRNRVLVLDVATSHTVGAALIRDKIAGFFEYHTRDITAERMEELLKALADGTLSHKKILAQGGHGVYMRRHFGFAATEAIIATGPKRGILKGPRLPLVLGAPWGDNMMTGTVGLLAAIRRRQGVRTAAF